MSMGSASSTALVGEIWSTAIWWKPFASAVMRKVSAGLEVASVFAPEAKLPRIDRASAGREVR